jgi:carboxyl-terminal processing protease
MKANNKYLPILIFATLAFGVFLGSALNFKTTASLFQINAPKNKLNTLIDFINEEYVDRVNTDSIVDLAVTDILEKLDPHSVYVSPSQQAVVAESMKGDFVGIGVNFFMYQDTVAIIKPLLNGPSEKAGIQSGDRILFANKDQLFGRKLPSDSLFSKLKGEIGSEVTLTIFRKTENKKIKFKVKRDVVAIQSVDVSLMIMPDIGYIRINRFSGTTYEEFKTGLSDLKKQGAQSLVIDVRDNGGGYLEQAIKIADELLKDKQLIVFTKNNKGKVDKTFATDTGDFETGQVFILINENAASASEILAGAIQDNDRGIIIGRRSFGKGLVQREMNFNDGSAVRLTVARYYTPTGRSIQKSYSNGTESYFNEFDKRLENGELYKKDSIKVDDTLRFKTPKGKVVYGGGGIVPDIFVPLEAEKGQESTVYLMDSGVLSYFVFEQLDRKRKEFSGLSFEQLLLKMEKMDGYFDNFQGYLSKSGLAIQLKGNKALVKRYLTAEFARQLFTDRKYYEILLKEDAMIKAVLKVKS